MSASRKRFLAVYMGSSAGANPTVNDFVPGVRVLSVHHRAGSEMMWAEIANDLGVGAQNRRIVDATLETNVNRRVEIWVWREDWETFQGDPREVPLLWGEVIGERIQILNGSETSIVLVAMEPAHTGDILRGMLTWDATSTLVVHHDPEWNPTIDGVTQPNKFVPDGAQPEAFPVWIDPASVRSDTAEEYQTGHAAIWTLAEIMQTLLGWRNEQQIFIENPSESEINSIFSGAPPIKDLTVRRGGYLSQVFDEILPPHGYQWHVEPTIGDGVTVRPKFFMYKRGAGATKHVLLQYPGENYNPATTNMENLQLEVDISRLANVINATGSLIEREFTIPLYRTWSTEDDGNEDHGDNTNPVGRKWAANEGGDYVDLREEIGQPPFFGADWLRRRRVMDDCLTTLEGQRRHPFLEYRTKDSEGEWNEWAEVIDDWAWRPLVNEIGVYFTGTGDDENGIPGELLEDDVELRITCTIRGDRRLMHNTERRDASPNSKPLILYLDLSDRYHDRQRDTVTTFASVLTGDADEADDAEAMELYVESLINNEQAATINASITLHGLRFGYFVGDLITNVQGRNISFNRLTAASGQSRFLQVVGVDWINEPEQHTVLVVAPYDV